jgi:hypothetical protein
VLLLFFSCSTARKGQESSIGVSQTETSTSTPLDKESHGTPETPMVPAPVPKEPLMALILGPGLNRSVGHCAFLKNLKNFKIGLISGSGMGAIVAAHFAAGKTAQKIEWLFYNFFNETKGDKPLSHHWTVSLDKIFLNEFKKTFIQDLKIHLVVPVFDQKSSKVVSFDQGNLYTLLKAQFNYWPKKQDPFSTPLGRQIYNPKDLRRLGGDIIIGVDVLGKRATFEVKDDFFEGFYNKILSVTKNERSTMDLFFSLPFEEVPLDSQTKMAEALARSKRTARYALFLIQNKKNAFSGKAK